MDNPPHVVEQVRLGQVAVLLGAGASLGATDAEGKASPRTAELRDMLSDKFLGGKLKTRSLSQVAEYAMSESSLVVVQDFIRQVFEKLRPTEAHLALPAFRWWGIATTNYDRLIEIGLKWTPLSRPFFARNKLMPGGVLGLSFGGG